MSAGKGRNPQMWGRGSVFGEERPPGSPGSPHGSPSNAEQAVSDGFAVFFRPDANAGVDQGAGKVQSENQDPPADAGKPRRTTALEGAEERQRIFHSL